MRLCDEDQGWLEPDLFNCTSPAFRELTLLVRLPGQAPAPGLREAPDAMPPSLGQALPVRLLRKAKGTQGPDRIFVLHLDGLELNRTALDTVEAKKLAQRLREVTGHTDHYFSQDVRVAARLLARLLASESHQQGFGLTATQDAHFNEVGCALCSSPIAGPGPWAPDSPQAPSPALGKGRP